MSILHLNTCRTLQKCKEQTTITETKNPEHVAPGLKIIQLNDIN